MIKYIKVDWPEYQKFEEHERIDECYKCQIYGEDDIYSMMIPEDLYEEVTYKSQFPKTYETNIGTITCYEDRAVVDYLTFWYDQDIKKGDKVLVYQEDDTWSITTCISAAKGFPIILEGKGYIPGINCDIIGSYDPEMPF